jgi:hypothetical protein
VVGDSVGKQRGVRALAMNGRYRLGLRLWLLGVVLVVLLVIGVIVQSMR